ncbi:MAG: hypothetical protein WC477_05615 [Patescibacteria group bacterium]
MYKSVLSALFIGITLNLVGCGGSTVSCLPACATPASMAKSIDEYRQSARRLAAQAQADHDPAKRQRAQLALDKITLAQISTGNISEQVDYLQEAYRLLNDQPSTLN